MVVSHDRDVVGFEEFDLPKIGVKLQGRRVKRDVDAARGEVLREILGERNAGEMEARRNAVEVFEAGHQEGEDRVVDPGDADRGLDFGGIEFDRAAHDVDKAFLQDLEFGNKFAHARGRNEAVVSAKEKRIVKERAKRRHLARGRRGAHSELLRGERNTLKKRAS